MSIQISPQGLMLQQQAMGMPRDQMQSLLNQQIGLIPLPELLAIKNAVDRAQIRNAPPQAQLQQTTVAQDLIAQKSIQDQMQNGVAALPVSNVGNEAAYARGGIVAFQDRGLVEGTSPFERMLYVQPEDESRMRRNRRAWETSRQGLMAEIQRRYAPRTGMSGFFMRQSDEENQQARDILNRLPNMSLEEMQSVLGGSPNAPAEQTAPESASSKMADENILSQYGLGAMGKSQFGPFERTPPQIRQFGEASDAQKRAAGEEGPPSPAIPEITPMTRITEADLSIDKLKEAADKDEKARVKELQEFRGEDVLAKQEGELKKTREERVGKAAQTKDMWLALSQGFFEMAASGKPTFGGALATGAQRGFEAYRNALDKRDALKEKYDDKLSQIALAKQAQAEGDYRYAAQQRNADQKELREAQRALVTTNKTIEQFEYGQSQENIRQARALAQRTQESREEQQTKRDLVGERAATREVDRLRQIDGRLFDQARTQVFNSLGYDLQTAWGEGDPDAIDEVNRRILRTAEQLRSGRNTFTQTPSGGAAPQGGAAGFSGFRSELVPTK